MVRGRIVAGNFLLYDPCTSLRLGKTKTMMGHLVYGRYGPAEGETHPARSTGWLRRLLNALLRRN